MRSGGADVSPVAVMLGRLNRRVQIIHRADDSAHVAMFRSGCICGGKVLRPSIAREMTRADQHGYAKSLGDPGLRAKQSA